MYATPWSGWGVPGRARRASPSRDQIVQAALRAVARGGFEQMTIRSLAVELGVAPMSLYRHIGDKHDLLDEVVEELLATHEPIPPSAGTWVSRIEAAAQRLRTLLEEEPAALSVSLRHPGVSPWAIRRMVTMLHILEEAGFDPPTPRAAYAAVQTYTIGFAALSASRSGWEPARNAGEVAVELASYTTPSQVTRGLRYSWRVPAWTSVPLDPDQAGPDGLRGRSSPPAGGRTRRGGPARRWSFPP